MAYVVYFLAYGASMLAFSFRSIYFLRIFTIISSSLYALYYFVFPVQPMWIDIVSESALVILNLVMFLYLSYSQSKVNFTVEEKELYDGLFHRLSAFEFFKLVKSAKWSTYNTQEKLIEKNQKVRGIYLIYSGEAHVIRADDKKIILKDGAFIGELSFNSGNLASADIFVQPMTRLIYWDQEELKEFLKRNPSTKEHFNAIITDDLGKKLVFS
ncbi:MAG: cyclic nucleotide-binding domain-containing protein [Saprospiraceae bacterium]|nr:cyclic nucleotide-binding domain-containing protein [Saprospiraceae bacterium]